MNNKIEKRLLTEDEIEVIKSCLLAVEKTLHRNSTNNEYYIDVDDFEYKLLADPMVKILKNLAENY